MIIIFRSPANISPPGKDPFSTQQHIQALSMRNKEQFVERMEAAAPVIEEMADVKPSTWRQMKGLFSSMESVGRMNMFGNFTGRMQQAAMFPLNILTTRLGFMLEGLMMPIMPIINKMVMTYEAYVMANQTGALIGGGIGAIVGSIVPWFGTMTGAMLGSAIGAGVEESLDLFETFHAQGGRVFLPMNKPPSGGTPSDPLGGASTTTDDPEPDPIIVTDRPGGFYRRTRQEQWDIMIARKRLI